MTIIKEIILTYQLVLSLIILLVVRDDSLTDASYDIRYTTLVHT
jgi:hypothetical protein